MLLELRAVSKCYATPSGTPGAPVLQEVDLQIAPQASVAITGPSGSGKTTLLNVMAGLDDATSGEVLVDGEALTGLDQAGRARLRSRRMGFVFQLHHLLPQCTVLENVLVPTLARVAGVSKAQRQAARDRAETLLEQVGLAPQRDYCPGQLSGGQCQRVAVVRALINEPALLLADEPTGLLDERGAAELMDVLTGLQEKQALALVVVTHAPAVAARMQQHYELHEGRLTKVR